MTMAAKARPPAKRFDAAWDTRPGSARKSKEKVFSRAIAKTFVDAR